MDRRGQRRASRRRGTGNEGDWPGRHTRTATTSPSRAHNAALPRSGRDRDRPSTCSTSGAGAGSRRATRHGRRPAGPRIGYRPVDADARARRVTRGRTEGLSNVLVRPSRRAGARVRGRGAFDVVISRFGAMFFADPGRGVHQHRRRASHPDGTRSRWSCGAARRRTSGCRDPGARWRWAARCRDPPVGEPRSVRASRILASAQDHVGGRGLRRASTSTEFRSAIEVGSERRRGVQRSSARLPPVLGMVEELDDTDTARGARSSPRGRSPSTRRAERRAARRGRLGGDRTHGCRLRPLERSDQAPAWSRSDCRRASRARAPA